MTLLRLTLFAILGLSISCSEITRGSPCGGVLAVEAQVVLPDTGIGAGGQASVGFHESEPGAFDESSLIVWTFPRAGTTFTDSVPRVRILTDDGRIFLDVQSTPAYQGSWYAKQDIPHGSIRDSIVSAFQQGVAAIEFSSTPAVGGKVTRVRPTIQFAGRTPQALCV
jgi:hypothetical protein